MLWSSNEIELVYETAPYWLNWPNFYQTQVRSLPCFVSHFLFVFNFAQVVGFVKVVRWISPSCEMDFSKLINWFYKLLHEFVKVVLCIPRPLPNKTKLKFDKYFKAYWSFCFELNVLNKYSMPWVRCAFSNVLFGLWAGWILEITLFRRNMLCITSRISIWNSPKERKKENEEESYHSSGGNFYDSRLKPDLQIFLQ